MKAVVSSSVVGTGAIPQVSVNVTFQPSAPVVPAAPSAPVAPAAAPPPAPPRGGGERLPAAKGPNRPKKTVIEVLEDFWTPAPGMVETAGERFERWFFKAVIVLLILAAVVGVCYLVYRLAGMGSTGSVPASDAGVDV